MRILSRCMVAPRVAPNDPHWWLKEAEQAYPWLRANAPMFEYEPGIKVVSRYDDIRAISRDPENFCSSKGVLVLDPIRAKLLAGDHTPDVGARSVLFMDPPEHAQFRKLVSRAFTPRAIEGLTDDIRARTRKILADVPGAEFDFVEHIAVRLPLQVIAALLGVDDVAESKFREWSDETVKAADGMQADFAVVNEFVGFMLGCIASHREAPRDDILGRLVAANLDGRSLDDSELLIFCMSLLVAGNETTRNLISGGLTELDRNPEQRDWLVANRDATHNAVEEMLRWVTPVKAFARTVAHDSLVGEVAVAEGDYVVMLYASANRDERAFGPTASEFNIRRAPDPAHLAFGFGEHLCLGATLARIEARVMFEELLTTFPSIRVTKEPTRLESTLMNGIIEMQVTVA